METDLPSFPYKLQAALQWERTTNPFSLGLSPTSTAGDVFSGTVAAHLISMVSEDFLFCAVGCFKRHGLGRTWLCYFLASHFYLPQIFHA